MGRRGRGGKQGGKGSDYPAYHGQTSGKGGDIIDYSAPQGYGLPPPHATKGAPPGAFAPSGVFTGPPGNFGPPVQMHPTSRQDGGFQAPAGRGMPSPGSVAPRRPPLQLNLAEVDLGPSLAEADMQPRCWPITPLGLPRTPPPLPPVPSGMGPSAFFPTKPPSLDDCSTYSPFVGDSTSSAAPISGSEAKLSLPTTSASSQAVAEPFEESWTPVADRMSKMDRRTFFHTEGKPLAFDPKNMHRKPVNSAERCEIGQQVDLKVEEVHFGNPRIKVMSNEPAHMTAMLKWPVEKFDDFELECAQIDFGEYRAWAAVGVRSNRILYAMKRAAAVMVKATVVQPPLVEAEDDVDLTYGASIQGIQLVP